MPLVRGRAPTRSATCTPSNAWFGSSEMSTRDSSGKAQSSSSIATPSAAFTAWGISSRLQLDRGVLAEHLAARDSEQQAVADGAGRAGHGHLHWT